MNDVLAMILLCVLLLSCEMKIDYAIDGQQHQLVLNP